MGSAERSEWMILACLGMVFTGGTHSLFIRSLRSVPAKLASLVCTMEPAYGIVAAVLVLSDVPTHVPSWVPASSLEL